MICQKCQTSLPEEAIACWKCGTSTARVPKPPPVKKAEPDIFLMILTFVVTGGFFVCAGWAVPFTIWGLIIGTARQYPQLSGLIDILSGAAFIASTVTFFAGIWWGAYKVLKRLTATPAQS